MYARRFTVMAAFMILAMAAPAAWAGQANPHFVGTPTCTKSNSTGLTCQGKAAGLDDRATQAFLTASSVEATWECVNHGGNVAPGQPTASTNVTGPVKEIMPTNGNITFKVTLPAPPKPNSRDTCPNGNWTVRLTSLTYRGVVLHIQQNGADILRYDFGTI